MHLKRTEGNTVSNLHFYYNAEGKPAMVKYNGAYYVYVTNLQGDIIGIADNTKAWVVRYRYDAWGKHTHMYGTMRNTLGKLNPFRYRGYVFDEETGDYWLRSRYYRPGWGRFLNADEVEFNCRLENRNAYMYCNCNPINRIDVDGHSWTLFTFVVGAIGFVAGAAGQIASNLATGQPVLEHALGAGLGGATYNLVSLSTGNVAAAAYASAAVEATVNEVEDYIVGKKDLTGKEVLNSLGAVALQTVSNGSIYLLTGTVVNRQIPINRGWSKPRILKTVFTGKYTQKVLRQTALQAIDNTTFVLSKDILLSATR